MSRIAHKPSTVQVPDAHARADIVSHTLARTPAGTALDRGIADARDALIARQSAQGYWLFELEADCTIPSEYILMMHFMDEIDEGLQAKIAAFSACPPGRRRQLARCITAGTATFAARVKVYYALKLAGDDTQAPHMAEAARWILAAWRGRARQCVYPHHVGDVRRSSLGAACRYIPVEIMLLPKWFPFHLDKVSYWSRTVMVPLFILCTRKPVAKNPRGVDIRELFTTPPEHERHYFPGCREQGESIARVFLLLDRLGRMIDPLIPRGCAARATQRAEQWMLERRQRRGWSGRDLSGDGQRARSDGDAWLPER